MKKGKITMIIVVSIFLVIAIVAGYLYFSGAFNKNNYSGNSNNYFMGMMRGDRTAFQLSSQQINEINSFFDSNPSPDKITSYCSQNRGYCFYYCRNLSNQSICREIMNFSGMMGYRSGRYNQTG